MFIVDEANEGKTRQHIRAAETTANKFLLPDSKIVYAYNPPPNLNHWANAHFAQEIQQGAKLIYTTYKDIYKLLPPATIEEIETMKRENPRQFQYWYMGQQVSLEGLVLYTYSAKNLVPLETFRQAAARGYQPLYIIYGVDSGVVKDPTAVTPLGVFPDGNLVQLGTLYIDPRVIGNPVPNTEQVGYIIEWYNRFQTQMREFGLSMPTPYNECWVFDSAVVTQDLMFELQRATGFNVKAVENKSIERDIKRLQNCFFRGILKILDVPENENTKREVTTFCYDENNEIPDGQDDHTIDALKYATAHYYYSYMARFG
jgi:phage terminase large subunit